MASSGRRESHKQQRRNTRGSSALGRGERRPTIHVTHFQLSESPTESPLINEEPVTTTCNFEHLQDLPDQKNENLQVVSTSSISSVEDSTTFCDSSVAPHIAVSLAYAPPENLRRKIENERKTEKLKAIERRFKREDCEREANMTDIVPISDSDDEESAQDVERFYVTYEARQVEMMSRSVQTDVVADQSDSIEDLKLVLEKLDTRLPEGTGFVNEDDATHADTEPESTNVADPTGMKLLTEQLVKDAASPDVALLMPGDAPPSAAVVTDRVPSISIVEEEDLENFSDEADEGDELQMKVAMETNKFPSVGPPSIIKYVREHADTNPSLSRIADIVTATTNELRLKDVDSSSSLYSTPDGYAQTGRDSNVMRKQKPCQFCGKVLPLPSPLPSLSLDAEQDSSASVVDADDAPSIIINEPEKQFCCTEMEQFTMLSEMMSAEGSEEIVDDVVDITPHAPFGSKAARRAAKERAAERLREREIERQRAAVQQANMFSFARQMKTIQYSLSSQKCMDEGWTLKPATPLPPPDKFEEGVFDIHVNSTEMQRLKVLQERFYENGSPFLTILPDGTGTCYYPNGNVAVHIVSTEEEKYTYIVQKNVAFDDLDDSGILGVFSPNGNSMCSYKNQKLRLVINAHGGLELDRTGSKRKRWAWYFIRGHVHTPPFQPLCFPLNKWVSVRVLDQANIALIFTAGGRSIRFNVGAKLKALKVKGHVDFKPDESEEYLARKRKKISVALTQLHELSRQPRASPTHTARHVTIVTPRHVTMTTPRMGAGKKPLPALGDQSWTSVVVN